MSFYANALKKNANVMIFLPTQDADDYLFGSGNAKYDPDKKYQTLYLLHGSYGDCMDWGRLASVERYAQQHCLAVVMPSAENSSYLNMDYGEAYLDYIGRELPAFLRIMFPLSERREDTFIAGLSMGGFGALRNGLKYSDTYGAIVSLSAAIHMEAMAASPVAGTPFFTTRSFIESCFGDPDKMLESDKNPFWLAEDMARRGARFPDIYMACGDEDGLLPCNQKFADLLEEKKIPHTFEIGPDAHEWDFWDTYIQKGMDWLPIPKCAPGISSGHASKD